MKSNVLFLVHCEERFRNHFPDRMFTLRLRKVCQAKKYQKIVILESEISETIRELDWFPYQGHIERWCWGWGYSPDMFTDEERKNVIPAHGHEWTWIPPELRNGQFNNWSVSVGGGSQYECLQDFIDILNHLGIGYKKVKGLIY